jgi:hypothetical protein
MNISVYTVIKSQGEVPAKALPAPVKTIQPTVSSLSNDKRAALRSFIKGDESALRALGLLSVTIPTLPFFSTVTYSYVAIIRLYSIIFVKGRRDDR